MATVSGIASGSVGHYDQAIGSGSTNTATALLQVGIVVNSSGVASQSHILPFLATMGSEIGGSGEFSSSLSVSKTSRAGFGARLKVGKEVLIPSGDINSVLVNGSGITESSGFSYLLASGLVVTVSGSYSGSKPVHNASIDFSEGALSLSGGLTVTSGNFSSSHTYNTPGKYIITTRVQDVDGSVNMEKFRLNFASNISGFDLGAISGSAIPEMGLITSESFLPVNFSSSGSSGVTISTATDENLWWKFGNNELSQKGDPSGNYASPGNYIPTVLYKYSGPSGIVYIVDSIDLGFNF